MTDIPAEQAPRRKKYRNFIHAREQNFIFAFIPKVGCTNWKSILRYLAGQPNHLNARLAHDVKNSGLTYLDLEDPGDRALVADPSVPKYTFVRDPYSRVLSAYLNKVASRLPPGEPQENENHFITVARAIDRFRQRRLDTAVYPEVNFEVFLLWVRDAATPLRDDGHWRSQTLMLHWPEVSFDYVGRFERMAEDAPVLLDKMGCDIPFPSQKDIGFAPTHATRKLDIHYTPATYALVNSLYKDDFINLGYEMREA